MGDYSGVQMRNIILFFLFLYHLPLKPYYCENEFHNYQNTLNDLNNQIIFHNNLLGLSIKTLDQTSNWIASQNNLDNKKIKSIKLHDLALSINQNFIGSVENNSYLLNNLNQNVIEIYNCMYRNVKK